MDSETKRKCLRNEEEKTLNSNGNNGEDMLSDLPDCVLAQILSKLPAKFAVGTAILSTRWKHLFPLIPKPQLQFDDSLFLHPQNHVRTEETPSTFADFTTRVLDVLLEEVPVITSFELKCADGYEDDQVVDWLNSALVRYPEILDISVELDSPWLLYECLSERESIECLALHNSIVYVPEPFILPKLYHLVLDGIVIGANEDFLRLLSGCPVLKRLTFRYLHVDNFYISIPSLEYLDIKYCWSAMDLDDSYNEVVIDTPALEELHYKDILPHKLMLKNLDSLRSADISAIQEDLQEDDAILECRDIAALVNACSNVNRLCLSKDTISAIQKSGEDLPTFYNLSELVLCGFDINGWRLLAQLLEKTPKLETLYITEEFHTEEEGCYDIFFSDFVARKKKSVCMLSSLAKIEIFKLKGEIDELHLIQFFFIFGENLNTVDITFDKSSFKDYNFLRRTIERQAQIAGILDRCRVLTRGM